MLSMEKLRFAEHRLARAAKKRKEGTLTCKRDGDRFYRLDIMFTTLNALAKRALPDWTGCLVLRISRIYERRQKSPVRPCLLF